jgi:fumarate reductase iron-sulfur subunit
MENFNEKGTYSQSSEELADFKQFSMCINCMLCYSACPVVANEPEFLGPAAIALGHRYNLDNRDEGTEERHEIFRGEGTVFSCSYANECSEVCPKNVDPAAAINQAKFGAVIDWAKGLVLPRGGSN